VTMSVIGNSVPYHHSNLDWMSPGVYDDGVHAFAWAHQRTIGESDLFVFTMCPVGLCPSVAAAILDLPQATLDATYCGRVDLRGPVLPTKTNDALLISVLTTVTAIHSQYGDFVLSTTGVGSVVVPKHAIGVVRMKILGMKFDANMLQIALYTATTVLAKYRNMDPTSIATAAPYVAVLAMEAVARDLPVAAASLTMPTAVRARALYNRMLHLTPTYHIPRWALYAGGMVAAAAVIYAAGLYRRPRVIPGTLVTNPVSVIAAFVSGIVNWLIVRRPDFVVPSHQITIPDVCCAGVELKPATVGSSVSLFIPLPCTPKHATVLVGCGNPYAYPVVPRSCGHNEVVATYNRTFYAVSGALLSALEKSTRAE
jgi:hypothetical protein